MSQDSLFKKYDVPAPRYTSYPTVPYWSDIPTTEEWIQSLRTSLSQEKSSWSLYIHVPFCETLCHFCGCNTSITKNHKLENPYVAKLLKEVDLYLEQVPMLRQRPLKMIHLGGGSPTFLSEEHLQTLVEGILKQVTVDKKSFEGSIEVDPRRTRKGQLEVLKSLGFNRVSLGVQDFDPEVQRIINRHQTFEQTQLITESSKSLGYESINFDLIYGLPKQTPETIKHMIDKTLQLRPDRIALYSFALVPWIKPAQRLFKDEEVPAGEEKRKLYEQARESLNQAGYFEIGMDHFALKSDALWKASEQNSLHRNFMGYTDQKTDVLLGIGVSSISESPTCFHQNEKVLTRYEEFLEKGTIPTLRGHKLSQEDSTYRNQILSLMCTGEVKLADEQQEKDIREYLKEMFDDELVQVTEDSNGEKRLKVLEVGRPFLRNACLAFDMRLRLKSPDSRIFSQSL